MPLTTNSDTARATQAVKAHARALGFDLVGIASAEPFSGTEEIALERVRRGLMDGLPWFHQARVRRGCHPQEVLPGCRSIIAVAMSYLTDEPAQEGHALRGRVARYAWGRDYHGVMERRLKLLVRGLSERLGRPIQARVYVDTGPMLDRAVAERAGLGWYGKSANILTRAYGSWVLLGQVLTNVELEPDEPMKKSCGRCTLCMDACPTGAIVAPYVVDNARCISYLTIECRGPIPRDLRPLVGDRGFGCDACQEVCPVNRRASPTREPAFQVGEHHSPVLQLLPLLTITEEEFGATFRGSAIRRARRAGLLRNVCVALGNIGDPRAVPSLTEALRLPESLVRTHAAWALGRIGGREARTALAEALRTEVDEAVKEEIALAVG